MKLLLWLAVGIVSLGPVAHAQRNAIFEGRTFPTGDGCSDGVLADLDGDAYPDLVTLNLYEGTLSILRGGVDRGFAPEVRLATSSSIDVVHPGAFDLDGNDDVLGVDTYYGGAWIHRGDGQGGLGAAVSVGNFGNMSGVRVADVDADGDTDVLVVRNDRVDVWKCNGALNFTLTQALLPPTGCSYLQIATADFDEDGELDIAACASCSSSAGIMVWRGLGAGYFSGAISHTLPPGAYSPGSPVTVDVDNDQHVDLVLFDIDRIEVLLGDGQGGFVPAAGLVNNERLMTPVVGDIDADGDTDLVAIRYVSGHDCDTVFLLGDGAGGFSELDRLRLTYGPSEMLLDDFDLDGHLDFVVLEWIYDLTVLFHGDGRGRFGVRAFQRSFPSTSLATADIDRDGDADIVTCETWPPPSHLRIDFADGFGGIGTSVVVPITFPSPQAQIETIELADVDGDGWLDLIGTDQTDDVVVVVHSSGAGSFGAYEFYPTGDRPYGVLVRDFDRDGIRDIFVANYDGQSLSFLRGDGTGFVPTQTIPLGASATALATRDVNGDGAPDLVAACPGANACFLVLSDGMGGFQVPSSIATPVFPQDVSLSDLNEDGAIDLVVAAGGSGPVPAQAHVAFGDGAGSFGPLVPTGVLAFRLLLTDLDEDGNTDLVGGVLDGTMRIAFGDGAGSFEPPLIDRFGNAHAIVSGDFDADGRPDLFCAGQFGGLRVLINQLGDELPQVYCTAKVNSVGCTPTISWTGTPTSTGPIDDFYVTATNVLNRKPGLMIWSTQPASTPLGGGTLCLAPPVIRTPGQASGGSPSPVIDCSGTYSFPFNHGYIQTYFLAPGQTIRAQYWSRDPSFAAPNNIGLTNALSFVICP